MKKSIFILLILISNFVVVGQVKKILFLGNSYTAVNNLPEIFSQLALSFGDSVYVDSNTSGGYRLRNHATDPITLAKISEQDWDFVVIQAQSQEPSLPPSQIATDVFPYATILNDSIKSNNACTETVFYMTWGRKYGDEENCEIWPPVCSFLGMQERLMAGYMTMAEQNNAIVAPVGLSWKHAMDNDPDSLIDLYRADNSHPSLSGSYLAACVMYATMLQKSPVGSTYFGGLSQNAALFLQQIAEDVVLGEEYNFTFYDTYTDINYDLKWENWFDFGNVTFAGFLYSSDATTYNFSDNSLNAETYYWDFGDGTTSQLQNLTHTYNESGTYIVTQSISNSCFDDKVSDTINAVNTLLDYINEQYNVSVYPNPGNGVFGLSIESRELYDEIFYEVLDVNGKVLDKGAVIGQGVLYKQIDLSGFNNGFYYLIISMDEKTINKTLVIQNY